jgi:hypothetical protein
MKSLLNYAHKVVDSLSGGRSTVLLQHERICIDAWRASLTEAHRQVLDLQLRAASPIQRQAAGAKLCFYYPKAQNNPSFRNVQPDVHAATVRLRSEGETMKVKIFIHRGRFFSLEFPKRPDRYMQLHHMRPEMLHVGAVETHAALD